MYKLMQFEKKHLKSAAFIEQFSYEQWSESQIADELKQEFARMFAAENDRGELVAFCIFSCVADEASLNTVATAPQHRCNGAATALLQYAVSMINASAFYLEVRSKNAAAIRVYEKLGFKSAGLRRSFYKNPNDDAVIMNHFKE